MAKKQLNTAPEGASAAPAAAAKPASINSSANTPVKSTKSNTTSREPRVSTAKHSRAKSASPAGQMEQANALAVDAVSGRVPQTPRQAIEKLAYGYFEARGYAPGNPLEDWVRAEREYHSRS